LRKLLKIKAYTILFAWLVIFIHNAIPHNHIDENTSGCKELIHVSYPGTDDPDRSIKVSGQPSDVKVCHVSSLLFSNFNHDNLIILLVQDFIFNPESLDDLVVSITDQSYISDHFHGTTSFRAPPAA